MHFINLQKKVFSSYFDGKYEEALAAALEVAERFPEKYYRTGFWAACLYCRVGPPDMAMEHLEEALQKGAWWSEDLLHDEDLQPLWEREDFARLKAVCQNRKEEAASKSRPELLVLEPEKQVGDRIYPIILALHNRSGSIEDFSALWGDPVIRNSYILAFPQSSQVYSYKMFCWDDHHLAEKEIRQAYNQLINQYGRTSPVLISGYSQGGGAAIKLALSDVECAGFIAIVPSFRDVQELIAPLGQRGSRGRRGCIITGNRDYGYSRALELAEALEKHELPCKLFVEKGLGHLIPDNFPLLLQQAVDFILL